MKSTFILVLSVLTVSMSPGIQAQDENGREWYLITGLYFWNTATKGDFTIRGVDYDAGYVFKNLSNLTNASLNLYLETGKNRLALMGRTRYVHFQGDESTQDFSAHFLLFDLAGGYYLSVDLMVIAGFRYYNFMGELNPLTETYSSGSIGWFEPILGARYSYEFLDNLGVRLRADAGGFGLGGSFSWHLNPAVYYKIRKLNVELGYTFMDVEYSEGTGNDEFNYNALTQGIWLGFAYHFAW